MSGRVGPRARAPGACARCLRRTWLLAELTGPLDFLAGDLERLTDSLALEDEALLDALAGRRRAELATGYARFEPARPGTSSGVVAVCRHMSSFPSSLCGPAAPRLLHVAGGGAPRLEQLAAAPIVAIVGSRRATDYGLAMANSLGRGLSASGITVASRLCDGIALATHAGALDAGAGSIAVAHDGLGICLRGTRRELFGRLTSRGCVVSELPSDCRGRRWGAPASARIVAELAQVTVVVEAEDTPRELAPARLAGALGRPVAALPGRVTSRQSAGAHALLLDGARLVRDARDVLELLQLPAGTAPADRTEREPPSQVTPMLREVMDLVGAGRDTPEKLSCEGTNMEDVLVALSQLELMGLLTRGHCGRYVPREVLRDAAPARYSPDDVAAERRDHPRRRGGLDPR